MQSAKHNLSSDHYVNACDSTDTFNAHSGISRKRLPQTCDNTDTVRSAPVLRKHSISARLSIVHDAFLCQLWSLSIWCISDRLNCFHLAPRTQLLLQMNTTLKMWGTVFIIVPRCKTRKTPRLISLGLNWAYGCIHALGISPFISTKFS